MDLYPAALSREQVRNVDLKAITEYGLQGIVLMENAGRGVAELLRQLGIHGLVFVCAGKGNNGGDGFVIARHLENHGCTTRVALFCQPHDLKGDAATNFHVLERAGTPLQVYGNAPDLESLDTQLAEADWIVDALLGTGTQGTLREPILSVIRAVNRAGKKVLAVDLPSGLDCDTGLPLGACIRARHTATFVAPKLGFCTADAQQFTGKVHVIDIGVPKSLLAHCHA